jgi:hypothetical protein
MHDVTIGDTGFIGKPQVKKPAPVAPVVNDPLPTIYANANFTHDNLVSRGVPEPGASYGVYQIYHETGAYKNAGWRQYRNGAGIMFANQRNATKGPNGYAMFGDWPSFFDAYAHELTKKSNPAGAQSLEDFNNRLVANRYYTANPADYFSGLKSARYVLKSLPASQRAGMNQNTGKWQDKQDMDIPNSQTYTNTPGSADYKDKNGFWEWWDKLPWQGKAGAGAAAALVAVAILKR